MLIKVMRSSFGFHAKLSRRSFLELSYCLHEGAKSDDLLELPKKPFMIFFFNFVIFFNIKKLELTFGLECFSNFELPWIWLHLDDVYMIAENNLRSELMTYRFESSITQQNKVPMEIHFGNSSPSVKLIWTHYCIFRIKRKLAEAMLSLSMVLIKLGIVKKNGDHEEIARRFKQRFRPFKPCIYCKKFEYEDYLEFENLVMDAELKHVLLVTKQKFLVGKTVADEIINSGVYDPMFDRELKDLRKTLITNSILTIMLLKDHSKSTLEIKNCVDNIPIYAIKSLP